MPTILAAPVALLVDDGTWVGCRYERDELDGNAWF
jgi:hypothetical protein